MKIFNDKVYNVLKYMAMIALPALAVFVRAFFPVWDIPYGEQISESIVIINALLGTLLGVSTIGYNRQQK
jgi:surface polysaccharide O-acyltransferase-like enzyme